MTQPPDRVRRRPCLTGALPLAWQRDRWPGVHVRRYAWQLMGPRTGLALTEGEVRKWWRCDEVVCAETGRSEREVERDWETWGEQLRINDHLLVHLHAMARRSLWGWPTVDGRAWTMATGWERWAEGTHLWIYAEGGWVGGPPMPYVWHQGEWHKYPEREALWPTHLAVFWVTGGPGLREAWLKVMKPVSFRLSLAQMVTKLSAALADDSLTVAMNRPCAVQTTYWGFG